MGQNWVIIPKHQTNYPGREGDEAVPDMTSSAEIGANLRRAREALGLTQQDVADQLSTSRPLISFYESGDTTVSLEHLMRLAKILDISPLTIIGLDAPTIASLPPTIQEAIEIMSALSPEDRGLVLRVLKAFASQSQH